ncbi:MAG: pyridoxamine 5'-phosphate oxidase family protein [Candidatus Bathyarchaeia archaeon]
MRKLSGLEEAFKRSKTVYLTTFSDGEEHNRPMTNFNDDPYDTIWFTTERDTRKVKDIKDNPKVLITFPAEEPGYFFEIEGEAEFAPESVVEEKWRWWYLYWHPEQRDRFWFPAGGKHPNRMIINIEPVSAKIIRKS